MYPYNFDQRHYMSVSSISAQSQTPSKSMEHPQPIDEKLLNLINEAIADETHDSIMYKNLMERQKTNTEKEILRGIYLDELKHKKYFEEIYELMTTQKPASPKQDDIKTEENLSAAYEKALFGEWGAVEFYRQILFSILDLEIRDMLYEIITDEQKHASQLQYLLSKKSKS